jgi:hypothetical protein
VRCCSISRLRIVHTIRRGGKCINVSWPEASAMWNVTGSHAGKHVSRQKANKHVCTLHTGDIHKLFAPSRPGGLERRLTHNKNLHTLDPTTTRWSAEHLKPRVDIEAQRATQKEHTLTKTAQRAKRARFDHESAQLHEECRIPTSRNVCHRHPVANDFVTKPSRVSACTLTSE